LISPSFFFILSFYFLSNFNFSLHSFLLFLSPISSLFFVDSLLPFQLKIQKFLFIECVKTLERNSYMWDRSTVNRGHISMPREGFEPAIPVSECPR
jgi:hypothetical protein